MSKNIVICLDGTGNKFKQNNSNIVAIFQMLERQPREQIAYYDPGVGTMGDPSYKTRTGRKINKVLGLAFGRGLTRNLIEAYTYLMENYDDGDKIFVFGFSRGAYTARALAAFIKECGLFERGAQNLIPYAMGLFRKGAPPAGEERTEFFKLLSSFRRTYGRKFAKEKPRAGENPWHYQVRIQFMGLFDTVKSYGWVRNPVVLRNEKKNPSVRTLRHALAIDERRVFFRQMHWTSSSPKSQDCREVWFPGVHSDVGGGYPGSESGLAKIALEWMVEEACAKGLKVDPYSYGFIALGKKPGDRGLVEAGNPRFPGPDATAPAHESLKGPWKLAQLVPKEQEPWEVHKRRRTIKSERDRDPKHKHPTPLRVHQSVIDRMDSDPTYRPPNLLSDPNDSASIPQESVIEQTERRLLQP